MERQLLTYGPAIAFTPANANQRENGEAQLMASNLSAEELSNAESRLSGMRDELRGQIAGEEKEVEQFSQSQADEFKSQHNADLATDVFFEERAVSTKITLESELGAVEQALARIDEGTYGTCAACGQPISRERLEARPQAIRCLSCEQLWRAGSTA